MTSPKTAPSLFSAFDQIRIVNLPHRKDRRDEMRQQLASVGLKDDTRVAFFPATACQEPGLFHSPGAHGCFLSHVGVLREAAASGSTVLILEDDCDFLPAIWGYQLPADWDVFYGGYLEADATDLQQGDIIGAHFMGFSARAARMAVDYFDTYVRPDFVGDPRAMAEATYDPAIRPPIDGGYVWFRRANPDLVTRFAMLSEQRASRSDITIRRSFDRVPVLRDVIEFARRVRRKIRKSFSAQRSGS